MPTRTRKSADLAMPGGRLRALLKDQDLSHREFAARIGVSQALVTAWCNENRAMSVQSALVVAKALGGIDPATICDDWAYVVEHGTAPARIDATAVRTALELMALIAQAECRSVSAADVDAKQLSAALSFVLSRGVSSLTASDLAAFQASLRRSIPASSIA